MWASNSSSLGSLDQLIHIGIHIEKKFTNRVTVRRITTHLLITLIVYQQILSRVITGLERDCSEELGEAIDKQKEASYPYYDIQDNKSYDCNMYFTEKLLKNQNVLYQDALPPRENDLIGGKCINWKKNYIQKDDQEDLNKSCQCMRESEIYAVYSPNRCYPEYVISYQLRDDND